MLVPLLLAAALPVTHAADHRIAPQRWAALESHVKAALECRQLFPVALLKDAAVPDDNPDTWNLYPPTSFTLFGMPVARVNFYIDPEEPGGSYTAIIENHSLKAVEQQLKKVKKVTKQGEIMASQAWGPHQVEVTCTMPVY